MNGQGRHYRDQNNPADPVCDYESRGQKCDFFASNPELASLPYPQDISLGPPETGNSSEMSQVLALLQQQKLDSDRQLAEIQNQVNQLASHTGLSRVISSASCVTTSVPTTTLASSSFGAQPSAVFSANAPVVSTLPVGVPTTPPQVLSNAAAALQSHLNSGLGHQHNLGYQPLTMDQLRSNSHVVADANRMLHENVQNVPPLNQFAGISPLGGSAVSVRNQVSTVEQLYAATMRNKQLKAFEFAASGQFSYRSQLKQDNLNAILFAYGSFKHLEAVKLGLIDMDDKEFLSRLRHLKNVFEIACLSINISSFSDHAWQIAREYDTRVISEIESGAKTWATLSNGLETDAIYCANQIVELRNKAKKVTVDRKDKKDKKENRAKACTTYNTHRASEGCFWEHNNRGESCVFEHYCSWCKTNRDIKEKHKVFDCEHKTE